MKIRKNNPRSKRRRRSRSSRRTKTENKVIEKGKISRSLSHKIIIILSVLIQYSEILLKQLTKRVGILIQK